MSLKKRKTKSQPKHKSLPKRIKMLTDSFSRVHDYLRISLTNRCNFRCSYCMPYNLPKGYFFGSPRMTAEEINEIASVFVRLGIKKIRLTGGEPLVRKDAKQIIKLLSKQPVELAITTNGMLVDEYIDTFMDAGIRSINISLDSLDKSKFFHITQRDCLERVFSNIHLLLLNNFHVKINVVVMKGLNETEIPDFIALTKSFPLHIRFIEFMPFNGNNWNADMVFSYRQMLELIALHYDFSKLKDARHDTARKYIVPGHEGTFAMISTMSESFCGDCNRLRLTSEGKIKNCLFSPDETDILAPLRQGTDIVPFIRECVLRKEEARGGQFTNNYRKLDASKISNQCMVAIGG